MVWWKLSGACCKLCIQTTMVAVLISQPLPKAASRPMPLKHCCEQEAEKHLAKHCDIATCDECGRLLLAYADSDTYNLTVEELQAKGANFDTGEHNSLRVVAKSR